MNQAIKRIPRLVHINIPKYQNIRSYGKQAETDMEIPKNEIKDYYSANDQTENGIIYDPKPFKFTCVAGKKYSWCLCGRSGKQPFCDGSHRNQFLKVKQRPIHFTVSETKDYWLCNCKQTSNRPFCDGTHLREDIQEKRKL